MKQTETEYNKFLKAKLKLNSYSGFEVSESKLNPKLYDFQKFIVKKALECGKYAIFADCGLGKTFMQLEFAKHCSDKTGKPSLIICPLAVSGQTIRQGIEFGYNVVRIPGAKEDSNIYITNYEQLENIDVSKFSCVVLDESSILKNYTGKYKNLLIELFKDYKYKLCCTATPSPNDTMEIGNHSDFLNVMPSNEMLARFFINDTMHFGSYRLKKHGESQFWEWVSSWAMSISKPSDIGFDDEGYKLPALNFKEVKVETDITDIENGKLFKYNSVNATNYNQELRDSMQLRLNKVVEIVSKSKDNFIIWIKHNAEGEYLKKLIPEAVEVKGSDKPELKEKNLLDFAENKFRILITKSKIAQFGMNFQNCSNQIFASLDFSFESFYQSVRRSYRFKQAKPVNIYMLTIYTMGNVLSAIKEKERLFKEMQFKMNKAVSKTYLEKLNRKELAMNYEKKIKKTEEYTMINGDCIKEIKTIENDSIDFTIFSPPFSSLYIYSDSIRDMGNCADDEEFFKQFKFLIPEIFRVTRPGRLVAVHCKNLVNYMNSSGKSGLRDFRGDIIRAFKENDFSYHSEVVIWKDPVIEMQRTKAHGLLYKQTRSDATFTRQGMPEYLLLFRKWSNEENQDLINPVDWKTKDNFPLETWQRWASPVWFDIQQTKVLNCRIARDNQDEKHICPLQLDVIERAVALWTNPGDTVFSPFAGIGSEGYESLKLNRKFIGIELKETYYKQAIINLDLVLKEKQQLSLLTA